MAVQQGRVRVAAARWRIKWPYMKILLAAAADGRPDSVIAFAFVDVDYTRRSEPDSIVEILKIL